LFGNDYCTLTVKHINMTTQKATPFKQVIGMGILTGMRSAAAPAIAAHILNSNVRSQIYHSPVGFIPTSAIADVLKWMALAEFLGDKLPLAPNRTQPLSIAMRCFAGGLVGAGIFNAAGKKALTGALLGCVIAGASTYGSFYLRKKLSRIGLGNFLSGIMEDAFVVGAGIKLAQTV
jgi:uncharacterized membrane protein